MIDASGDESPREADRKFWQQKTGQSARFFVISMISNLTSALHVRWTWRWHLWSIKNTKMRLCLPTICLVQS